MADGSIKIDTKIDQAGVKKGLAEMQSNIKDVMGKVATFSKASLAVVGVAIGAVTAATKKWLDEADRIDKTSQSLGLTKKAFQELDYVMKQNGASIDAFAMGARTLQENMTSNSAAMKKLGVEVRNTDGSFRSQDEVMKDVVRKFETLTPGIEKSELAQEIFGRSAQELMPMLNQQAGSMDALIKKANDMGAVMGDDDVNAAVVLGDTLSDLSTSMSSLLNSVIAPFVPAIQKVAEWIATLSGNISGATKFSTDLGRETNTLITATDNYRKAAKDLDDVQKGATDTERTLLAGRKELARLELQKALAETSKGYAKTQTELGKLKAEEAGHLANIARQSALMKQLDIIANGPPAAALSAAQALGISIESAQKAYGEAAKNFEAENSKLIDTQTKLQGVSVEYTETVAQLARAVNDGTLNIDIYKTTNKSLYDEIMKSAEAQKTLNKEIKDSPAGAKPAGSAPVTVPTPAIIPAVTDISSVVTGGITTAIILALNEIDREAKALRVKEAGEKAAKELVAGFAKSVASNIVKATGAVKTLVSNTATAISSGAKLLGKIIRFDFSAALTDLDTFLKDTVTFFTTTLPALPIYFNAGVTLISNFLSGIKENIGQTVLIIGNVISEISTTLIANAPQMIEDGLYILLKLLEGLSGSADKISNTIVTVIGFLAGALVANADDIVKLGIAIIAGITVGVLQALPSLTQSLVDGFVSLFTEADLASSIIIILSAAVAAYAVAVNAAAIATTAQAIATDIATASQWLFNAAMTANPIGLVVAGIVALGAALVLLVANWDDVTEAVGSFFEVISTVGIELINGLVSGIVSAATGIWDGIKSVFTGIIDAVKSLFDEHSPSKVFSDIGGNLIYGLINGILSVGAGIWNAVSSVFTGLWDNIKNIFSGAWELGKNVVSAIGDGIKGVASGAVDLAKDAGSAIVSGVKSAGSAIASGASAVGGAVASGASAVASGAGKALKKLKFWATGTNSAPAGLAIVGERGPELMQLGGGERIYPSNITDKIMAGLQTFGGGMAGSAITIHNVITAPVVIDGRQTARAVYENWDKVAK